MKKILLALCLNFWVSVSHAGMMRLVYDEIAPGTEGVCQSIGIQTDDLKNITLDIDDSAIVDPGHGFPIVIGAKQLLAAFHFDNFLGLKNTCGAYLKSLPARLNDQSYKIKWMSVSAPYLQKVCSHDFTGAIHIVNTTVKDTEEPQACVVKLKRELLN